ncbi:MAG TPA: hypothetical protein DD473_00620 [Planctomycetaceae bacterium]|nr:hypothetical protein [Planctomycetaceae bacterium]
MKYTARPIIFSIAVLSALAIANQAHAQKAVLYDFTATWCGPCQQMSPIVHKLEREGFPIQKVDIDQNPNLARQYSVTSIPAFVLVVDGREVGREVGRTSEHQLRRMLASIPQEKPAAQQSMIASNSAQQGSGLQSQSRGNTGYEQPNLGQPGAFPNMNPQPPQQTMAAQTQTQTPAVLNSPQPFPDMNTTQPVAHSAVVASNTQNNPVIRAQFDERTNVTSPTPHVNSAAANVRLRIRDEKGINYGSGTVIESKPGLTYVLTCGHIFRSLSESSKVDIDIFVDDRFESFVGKVEKYDLDADVGLVSLRTDGVLPVAKLANAPTSLKQGQNVISVGCSGGQNPTVENLQVTSLNRYTGPDNIECTGVPVQGRSGGGLFNENNEIVGVCIAADPKEKRGLYCGLNPVVELLEGCGLTHIIRRNNATGENQILVETNANQPNDPAAAFLSSNSTDQAFANTMASSNNAFANNGGNGSVSAPAIDPQHTNQMLQTLNNAEGAKLTIIIEKPNAPGQTQVVIIPAATARLLADLTGEISPSQSVATNRPLSMEPPVTRPVGFTATMPAVPVTRQLREEDRSETLPTEYSVAQPYRRLR